MLKQAVNHIDHVAIVVFRENVEAYVEKLSKVFGVEFYAPVVNEALACIIAVSWDSGLEILAPMHEAGPLWDRLQKHGEGSVILVFGVKDIDESMRRAEENGVKVLFEAKLNGDEVWRDRFETFREAGIEDICGATFVLGQIEPKY